MTIERASDNPFPSVLMVEGDPEALAANPAAGQRRLAVGTDHLLYLVDDAGVATVVGGAGSSDLDAILTASAGQDVADALTGAAAPDAGNVYATMADVSGGAIKYPFATNYFAETKPGSPNATYDDEFDDTSGMSGSVNGLAAKWAWRNQSTATLTYPFAGYGTMSIPAAASAAWRILEIAAIADGTYDMRFALSGTITNDNAGGMVIIDRTNGDFYSLARHQSTGGSQMLVQRWTNVTTFSATIATGLTNGSGQTGPQFVRLVKASTALEFWISSNGVGWTRLGTVTSTIGETGIGFGAYESNNTGLTQIHVDYLRKVA